MHADSAGSAPDLDEPGGEPDLDEPGGEPDLDGLLRPWLAAIADGVPGLEIFDAHTHLGEHDPDGHRQSPEELTSALRAAGARGCFVFAMHEPDGYTAANDAVLAAAARSEGLMVPFCRVRPGDPDRGAVREAERALTNGARGIKLHPRAEQFTLDHPDVADLFALADERRLPILIHAGRGIPALGAHVMRHAARFPQARVILAHAGVTDLAWMWRAVADTPNVFFDTAWWIPSDLHALFTLVPPSQIVFASDSPYGYPLASAICQLRLARQAGLSAAQIALIASGQSLRLAAGEPPEVAGPAVGERERAGHALLDRVAELLQIAIILQLRLGPAEEMIELARLACNVPDEIDDAPHFAAIRHVLAAYDRAVAGGAEAGRSRLLLMLATSIARTPDVPLPAIQLADQP